MERKRNPYKPNDMKRVRALIDGFTKENKKTVIQICDIRRYLKSVRSPERFAILVLNQLQREGLAARQGQQHTDTQPKFVMVENLPIRFSNTLSADTMARLIGSSLTPSAQLARLTYKASQGVSNVQP